MLRTIRQTHAPDVSCRASHLMSQRQDLRHGCLVRIQIPTPTESFSVFQKKGLHAKSTFNDTAFSVVPGVGGRICEQGRVLVKIVKRNHSSSYRIHISSSSSSSLMIGKQTWHNLLQRCAGLERLLQPVLVKHHRRQNRSCPVTTIRSS